MVHFPRMIPIGVSATLLLAVAIASAQTGRYTRTESNKEPELLLPVFQDGKWGFIDRSGRVVIPPRFDTNGQFLDGMAVVSEQGQQGYVDTEGNFTPLKEYAQLFPFSDNLARVAVEVPDQVGGGQAVTRFTFLNTSLRPATRSFFDDAGDFKEGLARAIPYGAGRSANPLWGFIDRRGRMAIRPQWPEVGDFAQGRARVRIGQKWGYIDNAGKMVIPARFDAAGDFREGRAAVRVDGRLGYVDERGATVIEPRFHYAGDFRDGLAVVTERFGQPFYFINRDGKRAFDGSFEGAGDFADGLARVYTDGRWGYIDTEGKFVIEPTFADAHDFRAGLGFVAADSTWGYVNRAGEYIWKSR